MKYIFLAIVGLIFVSCDDFLRERPTTELDKEAIYNSESGVNSVLNGVYSTMATYEGYGYRYFHLVSSTSGLWVSTRANEIPMTSLIISSNELNVEKVYQNHYQTIGVANDLLDNLKGSTLADTIKSKYQGEASFIRGISYFNVVRLFGKACLITKPVQSFADSHVPRSPVDEVYKQIIEDLNYAWERLPAPGKQKQGRPHKFAAKAMLAKVYLTMAGNDEASPYWQMSYDAAMEVYQGGAYRLVRPFTSLFGYANKNNSESIFEFQFHMSQGGMNLTMVTLPQGNPYTPNYSVTKQWGKTRPSKDVYDIMSKTYPDDPRIEASLMHTKYYNLEAKKDISIYPSTKKTPGANLDDLEYPFIKKYIDPSFTTTSSCNFVYYRYADLLLVLAEAANETGKTTDAIGYVNLLLERARDKNGNGVIEPTEISPKAWAVSLTKEEVRSKIMTERLIELTGEADEWYTVRRRGYEYFKTVIDRHNDHPAIKGVAELPKFVYRYPSDEQGIRRNLLLPFPQTEIGRNEAIPQDDQNFGY